MVEILVGMLIVLAIVVSSVTLAQVSSFKYYKSTYDKLQDGSLVLDYVFDGSYYFSTPDKVGKYSIGAVVFTKSDGTLEDIQVGPWDYIFGDLKSYLSPYSLYWLIKYKNWFEKNKEKFDNSK
jgi:hypothetical protein